MLVREIEVSQVFLVKAREADRRRAEMQEVIDARDEVLKNIIIVYSQASVRYASKMTDDLYVDMTD